MPLSARSLIAIRRDLTVSCPALRKQSGRGCGNRRRRWRRSPSTTISPNDIPNTAVTLARGGPRRKGDLTSERAARRGIKSIW